MTRCRKCHSNDVEYAVWYYEPMDEVREIFGTFGASDTHYCNNCEGAFGIYDDSAESFDVHDESCDLDEDCNCKKGQER